MNTIIYILGNSEIKLWGLTGRDRLKRILNRFDELTLTDEIDSIPPGSQVILLRDDYLFDTRLFNRLIESSEDFVLLSSDTKIPVAVKASNTNATQLCNELEAKSGEILDNLPRRGPGDLVKAYDKGLLKYDPPQIWEINTESSNKLEQELFSGSYKGVTDFITKWLWPVPARWATAICVQRRVQPNHVTLISIVLALMAGIAFWYGFYGTGLIFAWVMTFLDTVDGKLARVTLTSSRLGDIMDHGLDLIHPPLWYLAWGVGLGASGIIEPHLDIYIWLIFIMYIGGRICEGLFSYYLAPFSLFLWQPVDSLNRLITARRNPNLLALTISVFYNRPDMGLIFVVAWHSLSTIFLVYRVYLANKIKRLHGDLISWFETIDPDVDRNKLQVKLFTRIK